MTGSREKTFLMDGERINGSIVRPMGVAKRLKVASLNSHLVCVLCSGYYVEATAIVECLHTFCRSCIVKYLQSNNFCPICDVQLNQSKPWSSLRPDKTLQDLVYKLVPGLYQDEMRRRRVFYSQSGGDADVEGGEENGFLPQGGRFFSQDDSISLSLEYYNGLEEDDTDECVNGKLKNKNEEPKRYLQCPAAVTVRLLKKFLRMKYGIGLDCWVDVIYNGECLPEHFSLIDVAYTFTWKRKSPMRFAYRIFSKAATKAMKTKRNFQNSKVDDGEGKRPKYPSSLEQQMQSEYLGNFNLNPTNSGYYKNQNYNRNKSNYCSKSNNNNNNFVKNYNSVSDKNRKKDEYIFKDFETAEVSRDKTPQVSDDSNTSGLQIISEKEESVKENSEDSQESVIVEEKSKRNSSEAVTDYGEDAVDSFTAKKLLKNKHKEKRKYESHGERRRKSASQIEDYEGKKKKCLTKRRKTIASELSLERETGGKLLSSFSFRKNEEDSESMGNLKNEALRKVFVMKDKPETNYKIKDGEFRRKKRKKSKHHESDTKKRKLEDLPTSPSIMSCAKDPLKLKVKLTNNKPTIKTITEEEKEEKSDYKEAEMEAEESDKEAKKSSEDESKKSVSDKERLLHLRAVRHKNITNKSSPKDYINAPPSLTISKIDSSEQQPVKSTLVESRPSLEIMLVNPSDNTKVKKVEVNSESHKDSDSKSLDSPGKEIRRSEVVDNFGVLDLSEKSTRTKENTSSSTSPKELSETVERCRKSTHQSILQIAQTLVNRKLSPILQDNHLRGNFDGSPDSSATAAAMRNLKTLSDTAVNILMAAQSKSFSACIESQKRPFPSQVSPPAHRPLPSPPNSTKSTKDCENGSGIKIPSYPISRERTNPIPPVPNLHQIYPRGRGRALPFGRSSTPIIKPGQNQTVRHIPNPFVVLNRQGNHNQNLSKPVQPQTKNVVENGEEESPKKPGGIPPLQSIKTKQLVPKLNDLSDLNKGNELKSIVPKYLNNNTKTVQNGSTDGIFGLKNGEEKRKVNSSTNSFRKIEHVAAGLTARAVSNAMIDAK